MKKNLCLLLLVLATNVSAQVSNPLTGIWKSSIVAGYTMTLELKADGKGKLDGDPITYKVANGKLTIVEEGNITNNYSYILSGNKLTVSGGDIDGSIIFTKDGKGGLSEKLNQKKDQSTADSNESTTENTPSGLKGQWTGSTGTFIFNEGGKGIANGQPFNYSTNGNILTMNDNTGTYSLNYVVSGNNLTLSSSNGSVSFTRGTENNSTAQTQSGKGEELVGTWCYLTSNYNSLYSSKNSSFTNECFTLNANGTYTYSFEANRSSNTPGAYGFSNTTDSDQGTWSYDGQGRITVNSSKTGTKIYTLEKKNHPKNKDPMIFLEGRGYVTYYKKNPW